MRKWRALNLQGTNPPFVQQPAIFFCGLTMRWLRDCFTGKKAQFDERVVVGQDCAHGQSLDKTMVDFAAPLFLLVCCAGDLQHNAIPDDKPLGRPTDKNTMLM